MSPALAQPWSPKSEPVSIRVVDGLTGATLCLLSTRPTGDIRDLVRDIVRECSIPAIRVRLLSCGRALVPGPLPAELRVGGEHTVKLVRIEPSWYEALNRLAETGALHGPDGSEGGQAARLKGLMSDRNFVLAAVQEAGATLRLASEELRRDRDVVLTAVRENGDALRFAAEEMRSDREIVLAAVRSNGKALAHASQELRADADVVTAAVEECGEAFQFAALALRRDRSFAMAAICKRTAALPFIQASLLQEREFMRTATSQNGDILFHLSQDMRVDRGVVQAAGNFWAGARARQFSSPAIWRRRVDPFIRSAPDHRMLVF